MVPELPAAVEAGGIKRVELTGDQRRAWAILSYKMRLSRCRQFPKRRD